MLDVTHIVLDCTPPNSNVPYLNQDAEERDSFLLIACCAELGGSYHARNIHLGSFDDTNLHLSYSTMSLAFSPSSRQVRAHALRNIGLALVARCQKERSTADISGAVDAHRHALRLVTGYDNDADMFLLDLAVSLRERHALCGGHEDLAEAIEHLQSMLLRPDSTQSHRSAITIELAKCLGKRYATLNNSDDLHTVLALAHESHFLQLPGHPNRYKPLVIMGIALMDLFENTGNAKYLHEAVGCLEEVSQKCAKGHSLQIHALSLLSNLLLLRSKLTDNKEDLDKAVLTAQQCLEIRPRYSTAQGVLARCLATRYERYGNPDDIDASICLFREQLAEMTPEGSQYASCLNGLAIRLHDKADYTLNSEYLDESIILLRQAHALHTVGHMWRSTILFNLANSLQKRFLRNQLPEDLREALQLHGSWLLDDQAPEPHLRWFYLTNMADTRRISFEYFGNPEDLDVAIDMLEQASHGLLHAPAKSQLEGYGVRGKLGSCYYLRAATTGSESDCSKALGLLTEAVGLLPTGNFDKCQLMFDLAKLYSTKSASFADLCNALDVYHTTATDTSYPAATRLVLGIKTLEILDSANPITPRREGSGPYTKLLEAYRSTIQLLPQVAYFGLDPHLHLRALGQAPALAANRAACAARGGQLEVAVELLEEGRNVFWTQHLRLRTPLNELPLDVATQLNDVINQLEFQSKRADSNEVMKTEARLTQQRELSQRLTKLIEHARSLPGLHRFMLSERFESIARAAYQNPCLILLATSRFCGAIVIASPTSPPVQLRFNPLLSPEEVTRMHNSLRALNGRY